MGWIVLVVDLLSSSLSTISTFNTSTSQSCVVVACRYSHAISEGGDLAVVVVVVVVVE